jgi:hypothetical protein
MKALLKKRKFKEAVDHIYGTPQGKIFFEQFFKDCNVTSPKFSSDPNVTLANEGKRHLGMSYLNILCKSKYEMDELIKQTQKAMTNNE